MTSKVLRYGRVFLVIVALVAAVTSGTADARKKKGVGPTVEGSEVTDGTLNGVDVADGSITGADVQDGSLTGTDIDESTLTCTGPNGIPGCGGAGTPAAAVPTVTSGAVGTVAFTPGQTSYDGQLVTQTATSACPAGTKPIGAAYNWVNRANTDPVFVVESFINGQNWVAVAGVDVSKDLQFNVVAQCFG